MAAIVAAAYPELFAAVGVHSGLAPGVARDVRSAFQAMKDGAARDAVAIPVPTIVFHGDRDSTVHPANARQIIEAATPAGGTSTEREELTARDRRNVTREVHRDPAGAVTMEHTGRYTGRRMRGRAAARAAATRTPKGRMQVARCCGSSSNTREGREELADVPAAPCAAGARSPGHRDVGGPRVLQA